MKTEQLSACGVWIEFLDRSGNTIAQHVVDEWHGRPIPNRGDHVDFADIVGVRRQAGTVIARRFDVQQSEDGVPQVWVRLVVRIDEATAECGLMRRTAVSFSRN